MAKKIVKEEKSFFNYYRLGFEAIILLGVIFYCIGYVKVQKNKNTNFQQITTTEEKQEWKEITEKEVIRFQKNLLKRNPNLENVEVKVLLKKNLNIDGWFGFNLMISAEVNGKKLESPSYVFTNGNLITNNLISMSDNVSLDKKMFPKLDNKYYKDEYLISGSKNSKNKMVVFSDPLCPVCISVVPEIISDVKKFPEEIALYHIHFPLDMHPTAKDMVKAIYLAKKQGIKDIDQKIYNAGFEIDFDAYKETNTSVMLKSFNKEFNTNITLEDLKNEELDKRVEEEIRITKEAMVNGTPTVFFNDEIDPMRNKYLKYLK